MTWAHDRIGAMLSGKDAQDSTRKDTLAVLSKNFRHDAIDWCPNKGLLPGMFGLRKPAFDLAMKERVLSLASFKA